MGNNSANISHIASYEKSTLKDKRLTLDDIVPTRGKLKYEHIIKVILVF